MLPRIGREQVREGGGPEHAQHAPEAGEDHRLDQELPQDVAAAGPERLADADLLDALGDRHQHDVHHHDAADEQADRGDHQRHHVDAARHRLPQLHHALAGLDAEVVGLVVGEVAARAHRHPHLVLRRARRRPSTAASAWT